MGLYPNYTFHHISNAWMRRPTPKIKYLNSYRFLIVTVPMLIYFAWPHYINVIQDLPYWENRRRRLKTKQAAVNIYIRSNNAPKNDVIQKFSTF